MSRKMRAWLKKGTNMAELMIGRRSLILGGLTLVASPALVRASSLMDLRGYNMDPKVLVYQCDGDRVISRASAWMKDHGVDGFVRTWIEANKDNRPWCEYTVSRLSEANVNHWP